MWNLNDDNELDKLSREAAESYPLDQSPGSWNKLHARLDAEMPEKTRRRYLLFLLLLLVVGSGGFWISRMNSNDEVAQLNSESQTSPTTKANANADNLLAPTTSSSSTPDKANKKADASSVSEAATAQAMKPIDKNTTEKSANGIQQTSGSKTNTASHVKRVVRPDQTPGKKTQVAGGLVIYSHNKNKPKADKTKESLSDNDDVVASNPEVKQNSAETTSAPKNDEPSVQSSVKSEKKEQAVEATKKTDPVEKQRPQKDNTRWTFGAVYAPDISTVNFTHTQPLGLNLGVTVDYRLNDRFSLQTAFIYTKKNYKLNGDDYHPPKGSWFDYVNMKDVTGSCSMYDIPLNLRYNAVRKKSSKIFFTAGLSSYLMKNEDYSYYFYYQGVPTTRDRSYPTNDDYILSVLNISAGFEKKLNNSFSLQVEPFFKQSLTGVGFGEISLNSTGIYFSLRYNPLKPVKASTEKKR